MHFSNERMNGRPKKQMQAILYLAVYTLQSPFYTPPITLDNPQLETTQSNTSYTGSTAQGGGGSFKNKKPIGEVSCCE
jgi:hypothetical protein